MRDVDGLTFLKKSEGPSLQIERGQLGHPGIPGQMQILAFTPDEKRPDAVRFWDQSRRLFNIRALLSKTPLATDEIKGDFVANDGGSYLTLPRSSYKVQTAGGTFELLPNDRHEAAIVVFDCEATDPDEARTLFLNAVTFFFDHQSYVGTFPIYIVRIVVNDPKNLRTSITFTGPYWNIDLQDESRQIPMELRPAYALYREAMCSHSVIYKFFCFYKILEGYFNSLRPSLHRKIRALDQSFRGARDNVPDHKDLPAAYRQSVGTPVKTFIDTVLTPEFRDAIAHFSKTDEAPVIASHPDDQSKYEAIMLVTELCARAVIENFERDFEAWAALEAAKSASPPPIPAA